MTDLKLDWNTVLWKLSLVNLSMMIADRPKYGKKPVKEITGTQLKELLAKAK